MILFQYNTITKLEIRKARFWPKMNSSRSQSFDGINIFSGSLAVFQF